MYKRPRPLKGPPWFQSLIVAAKTNICSNNAITALVISKLHSIPALPGQMKFSQPNLLPKMRKNDLRNAKYSFSKGIPFHISMYNTCTPICSSCYQYFAKKIHPFKNSNENKWFPVVLSDLSRCQISKILNL